MLSTQVANDPDAALNENQAAELLGFSVRTLQSWRMQGGGPRYVKVGRSVRYPRRELIAFQKSKTVASTAETEMRGAAS
jgi:predicted DNA-binding transcriptional regulator AlpA